MTPEEAQELVARIKRGDENPDAWKELSRIRRTPHRHIVGQLGLRADAQRSHSHFQCHTTPSVTKPLLFWYLIY